MVNCCVVGCKSRTERKCENITFHTFPKDETVRNVWIAATERQNWQPTQYTRMCSIHFKADCFQKKQQKIYLAKYSIPTLAIHIASSGEFHPHVSKGDPSILKCAYKSSLEYENEPSTSKSMHSKHMDCQIETVVVIKATCKKYLNVRIHYTTKSMVNKGEYYLLLPGLSHSRVVANLAGTHERAVTHARDSFADRYKMEQFNCLNTDSNKKFTFSKPPKDAER